MKISILLCVLALPSAGWAQIFGSDPDSVKKTDQLIQGAEELIKETGKARAEIEKTMTSYNALFQDDVADLKKAYKDVEKGIDRTEKQRENVQKKIGEVRQEADAYFGSWGQSLQQISDQSLRKRSEERMNATKRDFDGVLASVDEARKEYEPFLANVRDQWTYMGHDLNPAGIQSLEADAKKLNTRADELYQKIDASMKKASDYVASLRSSRPVSE
jgi:DNA repair exonuclease SbcCD ATPase subunit